MIRYFIRLDKHNVTPIGLTVVRYGYIISTLPIKITNCLICGKEFKFKSSPSTIIKGAGKYCSRKCMGIGSRNPKVPCRVCNKMFYPGITKRTTCSTRCRHESRKTGRNVECEHCSKIFYLPKARLEKASHYFCCLEHQIAWQGRNKVERICKICGKSFKRSPSRGAQGSTTYCSLGCRDKDPERIEMLRTMNLKQQKLSPNKLERAGYEILKSIGLDFESQKMIAHKFTVDAYLPIHNTIIQFDGDYWHGNPAKYQVFDHRQFRRIIIDKSQNAYFAKCGYNVLRFWECDIKKRPEWVAEQIVSSLQFQAS